MTKITEDQLEQICLDWFRCCDYDYALGSDIASLMRVAIDEVVKIGNRSKFRQIKLAQQGSSPAGDDLKYEWLQTAIAGFCLCRCNAAPRAPTISGCSGI